MKQVKVGEVVAWESKDGTTKTGVVAGVDSISGSVRVGSIIKGYGKPTYRQYSLPCDQWQEWKRQAASLPLAEIKRHASVSTGNNHACVDCFCCACVAVIEELGL